MSITVFPPSKSAKRKEPIQSFVEYLFPKYNLSQARTETLDTNSAISLATLKNQPFFSNLAIRILPFVDENQDLQNVVFDSLRSTFNSSRNSFMIECSSFHGFQHEYKIALLDSPLEITYKFHRIIFEQKDQGNKVAYTMYLQGEMSILLRMATHSKVDVQTSSSQSTTTLPDEYTWFIPNVVYYEDTFYFAREGEFTVQNQYKGVKIPMAGTERLGIVDTFKLFSSNDGFIEELDLLLRTANEDKLEYDKGMKLSLTKWFLFPESPNQFKSEQSITSRKYIVRYISFALPPDFKLPLILHETATSSASKPQSLDYIHYVKITSSQQASNTKKLIGLLNAKTKITIMENIFKSSIQCKIVYDKNPLPLLPTVKQQFPEIRIPEDEMMENIPFAFHQMPYTVINNVGLAKGTIKTAQSSSSSSTMKEITCYKKDVEKDDIFLLSFEDKIPVMSGTALSNLKFNFTDFTLRYRQNRDEYSMESNPMFGSSLYVLFVGFDLFCSLNKASATVYSNDCLFKRCSIADFMKLLDLELVAFLPTSNKPTPEADNIGEDEEDEDLHTPTTPQSATEQFNAFEQITELLNKECKIKAVAFHLDKLHLIIKGEMRGSVRKASAKKREKVTYYSVELLLDLKYLQAKVTITKPQFSNVGSSPLPQIPSISAAAAVGGTTSSAVQDEDFTPVTPTSASSATTLFGAGNVIEFRLHIRTIPFALRLHQALQTKAHADVKIIAWL